MNASLQLWQFPFKFVEQHITFNHMNEDLIFALYL